MRFDPIFFWGFVIALLFVLFYVAFGLFLLIVVLRDFIHRNDNNSCDCNLDSDR